MKQLFEIDLHDYNGCTKKFSRPSARAIIIQKDRIALVYSRRDKYYKFPGGGIHSGEDKKAALIREAKEETGLVVIPESIAEFGSVMRRQKSNISADTVFEQENFYYVCRVKDTIAEQKLDDYEREAEFTLRYVSIDEAIAVNETYTTDDFFDEIMIKREAKVLRMIRGQLIMQELLPYAYLMDLGLDADSVYLKCGVKLDGLLEKYPDDRDLQELEYISDVGQTAEYILEHTDFPLINPDCFGRTLMSLLTTIYESMDISVFAKRMYELWQRLPESICHNEPFLTLNYGGDPLLGYGDERQTRQLYEKMLGYYM